MNRTAGGSTSSFSATPIMIGFATALLVFSTGCSRMPLRVVAVTPKANETAVVHATTAEMTLEEQVVDADLILMGTVARVRSAKKGIDVDGDVLMRLKARGVDDGEARKKAMVFEKWVYTPVVLSVDESLKGEVLGSTVEVRTVGGKVDGYEMTAPDLPKIGNSGQYVVFLGQTWDLAYEPLRVYRIQGSEAVRQGPGASEKMPVDELVKVIRSNVDNAD